LSRLLDVGSVVARFVGHQDQEHLAILADHPGIGINGLGDGLHGVLDAGHLGPQLLNGPADFIDLERRLLEHEVDALAEADNGVVERSRRFLAWLDVFIELGGDAVKLIEDGALVVLHADGLVEQPDHCQLVILEVAEDLSGELVERDVNLLDVKDGITGDLATAVEIGGRSGGQHVQGRSPHTLDLQVRKAVTLIDPPLAGSPKARRSRGRSAAEGGGDNHSATITIINFTASLTRHLNWLPTAGTSMLVANGLVAGNVGRVGPDIQFLTFALTVACQRGVEIDWFLIPVLRGECRRSERREDHDVNQERHTPGWQQVTEPDALTPLGPQLGSPRSQFGTGRRSTGRTDCRIWSRTVRNGRHTGGGTALAIAVLIGALRQDG